VGLEVRVEEFSYDIRPAIRAIRFVLVSSAVLIGTAGLVGAFRPGVGLTLLALAALLGGTILVWAPGAERLYARPGPTRTANVVGYRRVEAPRATLILLAHHDSKSQNLSFPWRMGATLLAITGTAGLFVSLLLAVVGGTTFGPAWVSLVPAAAALSALLVLSTLRSGNASPGGVDNAGSVALLVELARRLVPTVDDAIELIFLSPGAEEDHMVGAMRWLDTHRDELQGRAIWALNFDGAGSPGRLVVLSSYGPGRRFAPALCRLADRAALRLRLPLRHVWLPPAVGIDAIPFHHRGIPCLTFSSGSLGTATFAVHSERDVADHLDPEPLLRVAELAEAVVGDLARATSP
jgi:hypothetical protein